MSLYPLINRSQLNQTTCTVTDAQLSNLNANMLQYNTHLMHQLY